MEIPPIITGLVISGIRFNTDSRFIKTSTNKIRIIYFENSHHVLALKYDLEKISK